MQNPELISECLEDFVPWARYPAIQRFYDLVRRLNGPDSILETNDSGLRSPRVDDQALEIIRHTFAADPTVVLARLTVIFRDLGLNASQPHVEWMKGCAQGNLSHQITTR